MRNATMAMTNVCLDTATALTLGLTLARRSLCLAALPI